MKLMHNIWLLLCSGIFSIAYADGKDLLIKNATEKTLIVLVGSKDENLWEVLPRLVAPLRTIMVPFHSLGAVHIAPYCIERHLLRLFPHNYADPITTFVDRNEDLHKISLEIHPPHHQGLLGTITSFVRPYELTISRPHRETPNVFELNFSYVLSLLRRNPEADITAADILGLDVNSATFGPFWVDQYKLALAQKQRYWKGVYGSGPTVEDIKKISQETEQIYRELLGTKPYRHYQKEDRVYAHEALALLDLTDQLRNADFLLRNKELLLMISRDELPSLSDLEAREAVQKLLLAAREQRAEVHKKITDHLKSYIQGEARDV